MGADRPRRRAEGGSRQVKQETKKETAFAVSFFSPKRCFYIGRDVFIDFSNETGIMTMRDCVPRKGYWIQRCGAAAGRKAPPRVRQRCRRKGTSPCANGTVSVRIRRGGAARRWDESPPLQRRCEKAGGIRSRETPAQRESGDLHRGGSHSGGRILRRADSVCHLPAVPAGAADFFGAPAPHGFFIREELYYEFV